MIAREAAGSELARAKVNLALHVTGRRGDGYHLLDSLVVFPGIGDRLEGWLQPGFADGPDLAITGPFAAALRPSPDNLVLRAAALLAPDADPARVKATRLNLTKHLPVASGIGGGSADAAAALRLLNRLWGLGRSEADLAAVALGLGADVPMCVTSGAARIGGIGEAVTALPGLPAFGMVLVNDGVPVATPAVFAALATRDNPPLPPLPPDPGAAGAFFGWLKSTRNDLTDAARMVAPGIKAVLAALAASPDVRFSGMSGSGGTCFGLYDTTEAAEIAATVLRRRHPGWWIAAA